MQATIGNMIWRIGETLDFDEQLAWIRAAGFQGVGFHASAGVPGEWCGIEPSACDGSRRTHLRQELGRFSYSEIHAPLAIELRSETLACSLAALTPVLKLAEDLGVGVVTVHARLSHSDAGLDMDRWLVPMQELNASAERAQTTIALEMVGGFDVVKHWQLPDVGVNLDVGHMYLRANRHVLDGYGGIGNLIRHIGPALVHLHLHDVDVEGNLDHIEAGTGIVAFDDIVAVLKDIGYRHAMTLELNPDRVSPEGIRRSAEYVRGCFRQAIE